MFDFCGKFYDTDLFLKGLSPVQRAKATTELDEHGFHVFLERYIGALTVIEARKRLKEADFTFDGKVSFIEFVVWHFKKSTEDFMKRAPRDLRTLDAQNLTPEIKAAQMALQAVMSEIQKIEEKKSELEKIISEKTGIAAMKAKNELAQLLSQDQTEFNRALVTAQAAVRKAGGSGAKIDPAVLWWMEQELKEMSKYKPGNKK